jgi:hypothetical protein
MSIRVAIDQRENTNLSFSCPLRRQRFRAARSEPPARHAATQEQRCKLLSFVSDMRYLRAADPAR